MKHFYMNVFFCWRIETNFSRKQKYSYFAINKLFSDYDKYQFKIQNQQKKMVVVINETSIGQLNYRDTPMGIAYRFQRSRFIGFRAKQN